MSNIIEKINEFLTCFLYKIGVRKDTSRENEGISPEASPPPPRLVTDAHALLVHLDGHVALVVDHEFEDVPSWIEWDIGRKRISIAQMGGTVTELDTALDKKEMEEYREKKKIHLVARYGGEKIVHSLALIIRE